MVQPSWNSHLGRTLPIYGTGAFVLDISKKNELEHALWSDDRIRRCSFAKIGDDPPRAVSGFAAEEGS
jgi:hypothetical protein